LNAAMPQQCVGVHCGPNGAFEPRTGRPIGIYGRNRGISPGFVNTNTGYFGLRIRSELRHDETLRKWIKYTTLDCSHEGSTVVKLSDPNQLYNGIFAR
jgi:hypothetical protein